MKCTLPPCRREARVCTGQSDSNLKELASQDCSNGTVSLAVAPQERALRCREPVIESKEMSATGMSRYVSFAELSTAPPRRESQTLHAVPSITSEGLVDKVYDFGYEGVRATDYLLEKTTLAFWVTDGPPAVMSREGRRWEIRPRKGMFDFGPAGVLDVHRREAGHATALTATFGDQIVSDVWHGGEVQGSSEPHQEMQFNSAYLERIVRQLSALRNAPECADLAMRLEFLAACALSCIANRQRGVPEWDKVVGVFPAHSKRLLLRHIEGNLGNHVDLLGLSALVGSSVTHLLRMFRLSFGTTPHQFLIEKRIDRAMDLIRGVNPSLTELALELGFASHAHFSTAFKRRTGISPSEFRRSFKTTSIGQLQPETQTSRVREGWESEVRGAMLESP